MYKGAIFFDYDGTLTDENCHIYTPTEKTNIALEKLRRSGYATFLTTGRMKAMTTLVSGKFTGLITSNGAYTEVDGKCINNVFIPDEVIKHAVEYMNKENIYYALENQICGYSNGLKTENFLNMLDHFKLARSLFKPHTCGMDIGGVNQLIVSYSSESVIEKMIEEFKNTLSIKKHRYFLSADINDINTSKADGVKAVLDYLNIPKENSYAFGDGDNDYSMLTAVGHPIAMGDHSKMLESVSEYITKTVKQDGIFHALSEYYKII